MAVFKFNCPHCGKKLEAERDWSGMETECAWCGKSFAVPSAPPAEEVVIQPPPAAFRANGAAASSPKWGAPRGPLGSSKAFAQTPPSTRTDEFRKQVICPVCHRQYTLNRVGEYPCVCGTIIELMESGSIHVFMKIARNEFWTAVVKWGLLLVAPLVIALFLMLLID